MVFRKTNSKFYIFFEKERANFIFLTFMGPYIIRLFWYMSNNLQRYTVYLETALHVSGGTTTHHQELIQLYLQHLAFVTPLLLSAAIVRHPQHTQTSSNSSTIAAGSSNGATYTRRCRHSCLCSWWWLWYHPKHVEQFTDKINCVTLHLVGCILEYLSSSSSLLPRWHYSPMRTFASLMDFSQSALVFDFSFQFLICTY